MEKETSEKVVLLAAEWKFVFHFFKAIFDTSFRLSQPFFGKWNCFVQMETNLILDSVTPSSAFASLSMKQGEKTQKIVAKYVYDRFRERDSRVKYNLV